MNLLSMRKLSFTNQILSQVKEHIQEEKPILVTPVENLSIVNPAFLSIIELRKGKGPLGAMNVGKPFT